MLLPFRRDWAPEILGWAQSAEDLSRWCGREDFPLTDPARFDAWHAEDGVEAYVLCEGTQPRAYGELWIDRAEDEVELARILVAPDARGRGVGQRLASLLLDAARRTGLAHVWVRVVPDNAPAIACYTSVGFRRATPAEERAFNAPQPRPYVWLRHEPARDR